MDQRGGRFLSLPSPVFKTREEYGGCDIEFSLLSCGDFLFDSGKKKWLAFFR
jgi:hypothetical protein